MTSILFSGDICELCCSEFNKSKNAKVNCPNCEYPVCRACTRIYLLGTMDSPHCLNCKTRWELDTLIQNTLKSYVNGDYRDHRKVMLFDHEKSRMPETMPAVENYKNVKSLTKEIKIEREELNKIELAYFAQRNKVENLKYKIRRYKNGECKNEKREFKQKCPKEGCLGFLSTQWKCGLCNTKVCSKCLAVKEEEVEHICNEDDVKSAEAIKKETRSCPTCATNIYKIQGCDQMWCTQCHTAFSWKTGQKVNGVIHNPHFFQWQNQGGQAPAINAPGVQMCGGLPGWNIFRTTLRNLITILYKEQPELWNKIIKFSNNLYRGCAHFMEVEVDRLREQVNNAGNNTLIRIKYMAGEVSEDQFKSQIVTKDKKHNKIRAILEIYEFVNVALTETLRDVHETNKEHINLFMTRNEGLTLSQIVNEGWSETYLNLNKIKQIINKFYDEKINRIQKIREYANFELVKLSVLYSQTVGIICKDFYTMKMKFKKKDIECYKENLNLITND